MKNVYTKSDKKKILQYILVFIPFIKIDYFIYVIPALSSVYNVVAITISLGAAFNYLIKYNRRGLRINHFFELLILFNLTMIPFSVTEGMTSLFDIFEFYGSVIYRIAFCGIIAVGLKKRPRVILTALSHLMTVLVLVNILSVFLFPDGLYTTGIGFSLNKYWFLGYDNAHIVMYVFCIMLIGLVNYLNIGKVRTPWMIVIYILCSIVTIRLWSATAIVALVFLGMYIFFPGLFDKASSIFNIRTYIVVITIVCISIIAFATASHSDSGLLSFILNTVLHKDVGFNSRYMIWNNYLDNIWKHFMFGNGSESAQILIMKNGVNGAHNEWLQILYNGGIVHFLVYLALLFTCARKLLDYKNKGCARIVAISIFAIMIVQLMRGCPEIYWLSMYTIGFYISTIENEVNYAPQHLKVAKRSRVRVKI